MTFLRKRSRSQCSTASCDDDLAIIRKETRDVKRYSGMSSNTQVTARDYDIQDSCVLRNFPKHKSAHLRFLAWVQYTRQFPDHSITEDERRTCPLLWCRATFHDQDSMLKHVWNCEHLSKGLYWCFQCQKPERVGRFQCRRCQGGTSKTDRIATVAKKMFSALGSKKHIDKSATAPADRGRMSLSKISEASEACEPWNSQRFSPREDSLDEERPSYWDLPCMAELPNTCVSEMENTYVIPEMSGGNGWDQFSQELPAPQASGSESREMSLGFHHMSIPRQSMSPESASWNGMPFASYSPIDSPASSESPRPTRSILPRLNTNTQFGDYREENPANLSFSSSSNPMSADIVSPMSATGGFDYGTLNALDISPTDSEASGKSLFTDSGYSSATFESSWNGSDLDFDFTGARQSSKGKSNDRVAQATDKFMEWNSAFAPGPMFPQISAITQVNTMTSVAATVDMSALHSASRCNGPEKIGSLSPHWSDAQSLATTFSEVLDEHLRHSRAALKQMASNTMIRELLSLSSSSIVSIGFDVLAGLLEGRQPTAVMHLFAFTHIAYALAITVDQDSSKVQTSEWFQDSLSLLDNLISDKLRQTYTQIVRVIWQPRVSFTPAAPSISAESSSSTGQSENKLVRACKHFLDIQESFSYREKGSSSPSQFDFVQASFVNKVKSHRIIERLIQKNSIEAFIEDVVEVEKRLNNGLIVNLRQLELELVCSAKLASQSDIAYYRFLDHVSQLCDSLRADDKSYPSRVSHHIQTITLFQQLLPEEADSDGEDADEEADFEFDPNHLDSGYSTMDLPSADPEIQALIDSFAQESNEDLDQQHIFGSNFSFGQQQSFLPTLGNETPLTQHFGMTPPPISTTPSFATPLNTPKLQTPQNVTSPPNIEHSTPSLTNKYRCHCGYEPTGSAEWKASNFARHKRTQHASAARFYRCAFPGCKAKYRRSDNLRAHLRHKGHGDADLLLGGLGEGVEGEVEGGVDEDEEGRGIRPSKRRRRRGEGEVGGR